MQNKNTQIGDYKKHIVGLVGVCLFSSVLSAENWSDKINISGFMSAKYHLINEDNVDTKFDGIDKDGSASGTSLGINITAPVSDKITFAAQVFATQAGNDYAMSLDWVIASYMLTEDWQLRFGKIKFTTGLVSEYIDVGNSYPWINAPKLFYTNEGDGPNNTGEAYSGGSILMEKTIDDLVVIVDVYTGEMKLETMNIKKLKGAKLKLNWDDIVNFQVTYYTGIMTATTNTVLERNTKTNIALGMNFDWNNILGYVEAAKTDMALDIFNGTSGYATLGYQIDDFLPHVTYQFFEKGDGTVEAQDQKMVTAGLRYDLSDTADIKFEYSRINTVNGQGLFSATPTNKNTDMFGMSFDLIF